MSPSAPDATVASPTAKKPSATRDPLEPLRHGAWTARDPNSGWYLRYRFRGERYSTTGHPTWQESGRVEVVSAAEGGIVLRFTDRIFDGKPDVPVERELELAGDGSSFVMDGRRFLHEPSSLVAAPETPSPDLSGNPGAR